MNTATAAAAAPMQRAFRCSCHNVNPERILKADISRTQILTAVCLSVLCFPPFSLSALRARSSAFILCLFLFMCLFSSLPLCLYFLQIFNRSFSLYISSIFPLFISSYLAFSVFSSLECWSSSFPCYFRSWLLSSFIHFFLSFVLFAFFFTVIICLSFIKAISDSENAVPSDTMNIESRIRKDVARNASGFFDVVYRNLV
jgi:hypothetical protein